MKQEVSDRFDLNIKRVENLVLIYRRQGSGGRSGRRGHQETDVLRAAAVLLHASLEDVLRSLAYWKLPSASASVLEKVPLVNGTGLKFTLGELSVHRGKTIEEIIKASTDASLERSNYNNAHEVGSLLVSIGLNVAPLSGHMSTLDSAMKRRHLIVHRADANPNSGRGNHLVASISPQNLDGWIQNTKDFVKAVLIQV